MPIEVKELHIKVNAEDTIEFNDLAVDDHDETDADIVPVRLTSLSVEETLYRPAKDDLVVDADLAADDPYRNFNFTVELEG